MSLRRIARNWRSALSLRLGTAACLACLIAPAASSWAASPEEPAAVQAPSAESIPAAYITARADGDELRIQTAVRRAQESDELQRVEAILERQALAVNQLAKQSVDRKISELPVRRLESLQRHWVLYGREISDLRARIARVARELSEDAAALAEKRAQWRATRAEGLTAAPALLARIDELSAQIELAEKIVAAPLAKALYLGRSASELATQVRTEEAAVLRLIEERDRRLLSMDAPPLWQAASGGLDVEPFRIGFRQSLAIESAFARDHDAANMNLLRVLAAGALLLLPLLLWLRRRAARLVADGAATAESMQPLTRPLAAWLVLVALCAVLFDFQGPAIRQQAFMLFAWLPMLRLLPSRLLEAIGPWAYLSAGFYFLNMLATLPMNNEFLYRLILLVMNLVMLATVFWLAVRARRTPADTQPARRQSAMALLLGAAAIALCIAVLSNVLGNVSLALTLTAAILDSSYLGLVMYAAVTIMVALVQVLFLRYDSARDAPQRSGSWLQTGAQAGRVLMALGFVFILLQSFRIYRPLKQVLLAALTHVFTLGTISLSLGNVVAFVATFFVAIWLARAIRLVLLKDVLPSMSLPRGVGNSISTLSYYFVVIVGLLSALALLGFPLGQLAIVFGALGVGIGFGLQDVVKNFVAGLILMFERPVRPGDVVDVSGMLGTVTRIGMRATIVTTFEGADVVIPNGVLLSDKLVNWTLSGTRRRIDVDVSTLSEVPAPETIELLQRVAREVEGVSTFPPPVAIMTSLTGGILAFNLRVWTVDGANWVTVRSSLAVRVRSALAEAGIEVPRPQSEIHLTTGASEALDALASTTTSMERRK